MVRLSLILQLAGGFFGLTLSEIIFELK